MADLAQLVRAPGCGSGGRGFDPHSPPHEFFYKVYMKRVAIIGSPGTGKSTFARQLAAKTNLPLIHLDYYYHDTQHDYYTNKESWRTKTIELAQAKTWIIDGNFSSTLVQRVQQSDTIFYFDMPTYLALKGIITRWIMAKRVERLDMPDDWQEKPTWEFFRYVFWFRHKYKGSTRKLLHENKDKTIVTFKNHRQIAKYLRSFE